MVKKKHEKKKKKKKSGLQRDSNPCYNSFFACSYNNLNTSFTEAKPWKIKFVWLSLVNYWKHNFQNWGLVLFLWVQYCILVYFCPLPRKHTILYFDKFCFYTHTEKLLETLTVSKTIFFPLSVRRREVYYWFRIINFLLLKKSAVVKKLFAYHEWFWVYSKLVNVIVFLMS